MDAELIKEGMIEIASQLKYLGNGNAMSEMGAIENLSKEIREGSERIADAIQELARAVSK